MSCTRPLTLFYDSVDSNGKKHTVKIAAADDSDLEYANSHGWFYVRIPCGQCASCRMNYARLWANRIVLEDQQHDSGYFVTLTYLDSALYEHSASDRLSYTVSDCVRVDSLVHHFNPDGKSQVISNISCVSDPLTGSVCGSSLTLNKIDWQLFMKRLRQALPWHGKDDPVRFFMCGEYGSQTWRPHMHAIIWMRLPDDDLIPYKRNELGQQMYFSKLLAELWPFGMNVVAPITWESACYVARYTMKKYTGPEAQNYVYAGMLPPFTLMSRRPGIAGNVDLDEVFSSPKIVLPASRPDKPLIFPPPRYLEKLYEVSHPEDVRDRRLKRTRSAERAERAILSKTDLSLKNYFSDLEKNFDKASDVVYTFRSKI